jgi:elongation factor P hydroxylase
VSAALPAAACEDGFRASRLEQLFRDCFAARWRTLLVGGAREPFYQPAPNDAGFHLLHYRLDYFASALHEVAHWCIAGAERRQLPDFGYWYEPDGRNATQQRAFEAVEYKPQALEWFFSRASGYRFRLSSDNLAAHGDENTAFALRVLEQARHWRDAGLPTRAGLFFAALSEAFGTGLKADALVFELEELR